MTPVIAHTATEKAILRLDSRIAKLANEREALTRQLAAEQGFNPCDDCFNGYCSMNCSSALGYMKVLV